MFNAIHKDWQTLRGGVVSIIPISVLMQLKRTLQPFVHAEHYSKLPGVSVDHHALIYSSPGLSCGAKTDTLADCVRKIRGDDKSNKCSEISTRSWHILRDGLDEAYHLQMEECYKKWQAHGK